MRQWSLLLLVSAVLFALPASAKPYQPMHGDVVFQTLQSGPLVQAIETVSQSHFSHCGIVVLRKDGVFVLEAMDTVHFTPWEEWVAQGSGGRFEVYRLKNLKGADRDKFVDGAIKYLGLPYDYHYKMDDEHIYCSELVYKGFKVAMGRELAPPQKLKDLNWRASVAFILVWEMGSIPLERDIITPVALTRSAEFQKVYSNYPDK